MPSRHATYTEKNTTRNFKPIATGGHDPDSENARDGVVAWQCCVEQEGARTESIEVRSSHCGLGHHPAALYVIADRLALAEEGWAPFERKGLRSLFYPDPWRNASSAA